MLLSDEMKSATKTAHQALEKLIISKIKNTGSLSRYEQLLKMFLGFYRPVESKIDQYISASVIPDYTLRRKSQNIVHDLEVLSLHANYEQPVMISDTSFINSRSAALGALYVLEGSTLGGTIISGMLTRHAAVPEAALTFFNAYGEKNELMWRSFVQSMNAFGEENGHHEIIQAAIQTFDQFRNWADLFYKAPANTYDPSSDLTKKEVL